MSDRTFKGQPFADEPYDVKKILLETSPDSPISVAQAELRLAEVLAHIAEIGAQIESKNRSRKRQWASDPHEAWRVAAMRARDELRHEEKSLRAFIERTVRDNSRLEKVRRTVEEYLRQEVDKATRDARKNAQKVGSAAIWDVYLKAEVALLSIMASGSPIGTLGDVLIQTSKETVPEWYRLYWLRSVYGTTWGKHSAGVIKELVAAGKDGKEK